MSAAACSCMFWDSKWKGGHHHLRFRDCMLDKTRGTAPQSLQEPARCHHCSRCRPSPLRRLASPCLGWSGTTVAMQLRVPMVPAQQWARAAARSCNAWPLRPHRSCSTSVRASDPRCRARSCLCRAQATFLPKYANWRATGNAGVPCRDMLTRIHNAARSWSGWALESADLRLGLGTMLNQIAAMTVQAHAWAARTFVASGTVAMAEVADLGCLSAAGVQLTV